MSSQEDSESDNQVIRSSHLQVQCGKKWKKMRCMIQKRSGIPYFYVCKKGGVVKRFFEITTQVTVEKREDDANSFTIVIPGNNSIGIRSGFPKKVGRWVALIKQLASQCHYTMKNFEILTVLGKGYYGKVMLCRKNGTQEVYAIKTVHKSRLVKSNKIHTIFSERNTLMKAQHPFIVQIYFAFQNETKFYIGLEFIPGGELFKRVSEEDIVPIHDARIYVAEAALALQHLHKHNIIFRDLKPENIMMGADGHIKLTDFGLAKETEGTTSTFCGTNEYMAPEIVKERPYDDRVDWWSLGCLTYELLFGWPPFRNERKSKLFKEICKKKPEFPEDADRTAVEFILALLEKKPEDRLTFAQLKKHPFFQGMKFKDVLLKKYQPDYIPAKPEGNDAINFDSSFTQMSAADSMATPVAQKFDGFSFVAPVPPEIANIQDSAESSESFDVEGPAPTPTDMFDSD